MDTHTIAAQIRARRAMLRLSQAQLAAAAGTTRQTVIAAEADRDTYDLKVSTLRRMAKALGCRLVITLNDG